MFQSVLMQRHQDSGDALASPMHSLLQFHHPQTQPYQASAPLPIASRPQQQQQQQRAPTAAVSIPLPRYPCSAPAGDSRRAGKRHVQFADESPTDFDEFGSSYGSAPKRLCSFLEETNMRLSRISIPGDSSAAAAAAAREEPEPPAPLPGTAAALQAQVRVLSCSSDEAAVTTAIKELSRLFLSVPAAQQEQVAAASGGIRALILATSSRSGNSCCGATGVQLAAAKALTALAEASSAYQAALAAAAGVKLLVELVARSSRGGSLAAAQVAEAAAAGLVAMTMCGHAAGIAATVAAGGVRVLVQAASGGQPALRLQAVRALCNISSGPTQHRSSIADAGGLPVLIELLTSNSSSSSSKEVQYAVINTLDSLAVYSPAHKRVLSEGGAVKAAVQLLRGISNSSSSASSSVPASSSSSEAGLTAALQEAAAGFLETLVTRSPANLLAVEAAGGIRLLQQLVRRCNSAGGGSSVSSSLGSLVVAEDAIEGVREAAVSALRRMNAVIPLN